MRRRIGQDDFERRPDHAGHKVPAARGAVGQAEDDMNVKARLAVVADGDVADRTQDLALLVDLDLLVGFRSISIFL
jgi:hypothetical protein